MTTQQWVFIEPDDVWMFRDSKPFTAGESFFARSMFPPQPGTVQGMIRTHYYHRTGQIIGGADSMGDMRVTGAFLARKAGDQQTVERLYPLPLDVLHGAAPRRLAPARQRDFDTDLDANWRPLVPVTETGDTPSKPEVGDLWLDQANFDRYLAGTDFTPIPEDDLYQFEDRTGLALDYRRRAGRESQFYRASFVRPCPEVGLLVGVAHPDQIFETDTGTLAVGGESRMGRYQIVPLVASLPKVPSGRIKLILLTPAYFNGGWQPAAGWQHWLGTNARLISAAVGKPGAFSGWDYANKCPKVLRHFVPAGSVYYFENAMMPEAPLTETPDSEADYGAMGYGAFAAAQWDYVDNT